MITIQVEGIEQLQRQLRALPAAFSKGIAAGINRTARAIEQHELVEMERTLDRPTPFTLNAIKVSEARADKPEPSAIIYIQPLQAKYLTMTIRGGTLPRVLTPINVKVNAYGNILGKREGLNAIALRGKKRFVATINGTTGVWERIGPKGRGIRLLVMVKREQPRAARFDFYGVGQRVANERLTSDVTAAIQDAMRST
jgi:hypothetical protein